MLILTKTIKPQRLKDKAMRLTLLAAMKKFGTVVKKDFQGTTKTWTHKPKFESVISLTGPGPVLLVGTDDERYRWISDGTGLWGPKKKRYPIWAGYYTGKSDKKVLAFPSMSTPKTQPGSLKSGAGSKGEVDTFRAMVMHTGIKPRDFSGQIKKLETPKYKRAMEAAMRKARDVSGNPA